MPVSGVSSIAGGIISKDAGKSEVSENGFYKILAAELSNQDPLNSKSGTEYVAQMAQFSTLQQMMKLRTTMEGVLLSQRLQEGSSMVGKTVKIYVDDKTTVTGRVTSVKAYSDAVNVMVGGKEYSIDNVEELLEDKSSLSQKLQESSLLIGKTVKINAGDNTTVTGQVTSVKASENGVNVVVDGKEYSIDSVQELSAGEGGNSVVQNN